MSFSTCVLTLFLCLPGQKEQLPTERGKVDWFNGTWQQLLDEARTSQRIVYVDFWAEWCKPCEEMLDTLDDKVVLRELEGFLCYSIDIDSQLGRPLTREYKVKSYPTLLFLDSDGTPRDRLSGFFGPREFVRELRRIKRNEGTLGALRAHIQRSPKDLNVRYELALKLRGMGDLRGYEEQVRAIRELDPAQTSLPARKLDLDRVLAELRQSFELGPLYDLLEHEKYGEILFKGWYEAWKYEGLSFHRTEDESAAARHRERWAKAARQVWKHVPEDKVARFGNYIAWSFYEQREALTRADLEFALRVAQAAVEGAPQDAAVVDTLACCLHALGRREEALELVMRCISLDPANEQWKERLRAFSVGK